MLKSESGFGMIQALIGFMLLGFLSIAGMRMIETTNQGQKGAQSAIEFDLLRVSLHQVLATPSLCGVSLLKSASPDVPASFNPALNPASDLSVVKVGASTIATVGRAIGAGARITRLQLSDTGATPLVDGATGQRTYRAQLVFDVTRSDGSLGQKVLSNQQNPFVFKLVTDSAFKIVSCESIEGGGVSMSDAQVCASLGGTWNAGGTPPCGNVGGAVGGWTPDKPSAKVINCTTPRSGPYYSPCTVSCPTGMTVLSGTLSYTGNVPATVSSDGATVNCPNGAVSGRGGNVMPTTSTCQAVCYWAPST